MARISEETRRLRAEGHEKLRKYQGIFNAMLDRELEGCPVVDKDDPDSEYDHNGYDQAVTRTFARQIANSSLVNQ